MKRIRVAVATVAILSLVAAPAAGDDSRRPKRARTETQSYGRPGNAAGNDNVYVGQCNPGVTSHTEGCVHFEIKPTEDFISLTIKDATGQPVYATVWDSMNNYMGEFCGKTDEPLISPGVPFYVEMPVHAMSYCRGVATQGTVIATFLRHNK